MKKKMDAPLFSDNCAKLVGILRQICNEGSEELPEWQSQIDTAFSLTDSLTHSLCMDSKEGPVLEKLTVDLWNKTSILKSRGNLQQYAYAKLRHISFQVDAFFNESVSNERALKKQILMGIKATRAWIDCKEFEYADEELKVLTRTLQRLQFLFVEKKNVSLLPHVLEKEKGELDLDLFRVLCLKAEVRFGKSEYSEAVVAVNRAKEMLSRFPHESSYLTMLCYNFGVDCYKEKHFDHGIVWLRESYNLGKDSLEINHKTQARTLRLLANCYMEWECDGWQENALNAVSLANEEHSHSAGMYLKLQLLILTGETANCVKRAMEDLLHHPDCNVDLCLNAMQLFKKYNRSEVIYDLRHDIIKKFEMRPDIGDVLVILLDVFLTSIEIHDAKTFVEECIIAHNTGQRLDGATTKQFHAKFWAKAAHYFENENYSEALAWYNYSLSLYPSLSHSEPNLGKLQRNLATCYLHLGDAAKALSAIEVSQRCEPRNPHTYYILFKVALEMDDAEKAISSLQSLIDCVPEGKNSEDSNIICLAAHVALEQEKIELAVPALECLVTHSKDDRRVITGLRCLLRLLVTQIDQDQVLYKCCHVMSFMEDLKRTISSVENIHVLSFGAHKRRSKERHILLHLFTDMKVILAHTRTAYNKLLEVKDKENMPSAEIQEEATWFMKLAWNLALQCKDDPYSMKEFFILCFQLLSLCAPDIQNYSRHQNCLLMSCAACLQLARGTKDQSTLHNLLEEVLVHVEEYKQAEKKAQKTLWTQGPVKTSPSADTFLLMYEFEALTKLKDQRSESVLERALTLPSTDPKLFHILAALAVDPPANNRRLSIRALKVAIRQHLQMENPDFKKCSIDLRNLIELAMNGSDQEAQTYFNETLEVIETRAKEKYPEVEILWLMTKSWNFGLQFYNCGRFQDSEQWCSISMKFLKYLPSMKDDYVEQMTSLYREIMNNLQRQACIGSVES